MKNARLSDSQFMEVLKRAVAGVKVPDRWRDLDEVLDFATGWIRKYNHERPNMAVGVIIPMRRVVLAAKSRTSGNSGKRRDYWRSSLILCSIVVTRSCSAVVTPSRDHGSISARWIHL